MKETKSGICRLCDIDTFFKTVVYACRYKLYGKIVDAIKTEDITISIIREAKSVRLFCHFKEYGYEIM